MFRLVLVILVLGFSTGCGKSNQTSEEGEWFELPYNVKAYVATQTCTGRKLVLSSDLRIDFKDADLADGVTREMVSSAEVIVSCQANKEAPLVPCNEYTYGANKNIPTFGLHSNNLPFLTFPSIDEPDFSVILTAEFKVTGEQDTLPLVILPVEVKFPGRLCGDPGNIECNYLERPNCLETPESHQCTFNYETCALGETTCAEGYRETEIIADPVIDESSSVPEAPGTETSDESTDEDDGVFNDVMCL